MDPNQANSTSTQVAPHEIESVQASLRRLIARARLVLSLQRIFLLIGIALLALVSIAALDFMLRFPVWIRTGHLIVGAIAMAYVVWRFILPATRFAPTPAAVALRLEKHDPELRGLLASGVEFSEAGDASSDRSEFSQKLAQSVVHEAAEKFSAARPSGVIETKQFARSAVILTLMVALVASVTITSTTIAAIGAQRQLLPWTGAQWPKRTLVRDVTTETVHPLGAAFSLQAALVRTNRSPDRTDVAARYRVVRDGVTGPTRRVLLTWQDRLVSVAGYTRTGAESDTLASGELFERLVEVDGDYVEYRFETLDDQTPWKRVELVAPPEVLSAMASVTPPAYAAELAPAVEGALDQQFGFDGLDMGPGRDERAIAPRSLAGSAVELRLALNKPTPVENSDIWMAATFGESLARRARLEASDDGLLWTLQWTLDESVRIPVALVDEHDIVSVVECVYRFDAMQDRAPEATITEPETDINVLATATVDVTAEGRDDVGLAWVSLQRQRAKPAGDPDREPSGPGGAIEPVEDEPVEILRTEALGRRTALAQTQIDLSVLGVRPGDQVWLSAVVADVFAVEGAAREPSRSLIRRLYVISEAEFIEEIRRELGAVRQSAIRMYEEQIELRNFVSRRGATEAAREDQARLSEQIAREAEAIEQLLDRAGENGLTDEQLDGLLDDASGSLEEAGKRSAEASNKLDDAARDMPQDGEERDADAEQDPEEEGEDERENPLDEMDAVEIEQAQRGVESELQSLIEMLDRGEDSWVVRRQLEGLLEEQQDLREQTTRSGRETAGRELDDLDERELSELERIVQKQLELAGRMEELADNLGERSRDLEDSDPTASAGMAEAARTANEGQVDQLMEEAADQASQNQMAGAAQSQQEAIEQLQEMMEDLDRAERAREEVLSRMLASIIDSLEGLIRQQETAIASLDDAVAASDFNGLDTEMIALNQNTLGVLDQAKLGGPELGSVAALIGRASESQTRAIIGLRAVEVDHEQVRTNEESSLELLREAREEARKAQQEQQRAAEERKKAELRKQYRELLEQQVAIRAETGPFTEIENLSRRDRATLRKLGEQQSGVRDALSAIVEETEELSDATIFDYTHRKLDKYTLDAADALRSTEPAESIDPQDVSIMLLQGLVEALAENQSQQDESEFNQQQQGGGQGGPQPPEGLIPPIAELKLLKQLQVSIAERTRRVADDPADQADRARALGEEQRDLADLGEELMERMSEQQPQGLPGGGG